MMRHIVVCAAVVLASCGGGTSSPVAPSPGGSSAATLLSLSLSTPSTIVLVGASQDIVATGQFSDGTSRTVSATLSSSAADIIGVENGRLIARSAGIATIMASSGGQTAAIEIRALPDFAGRWAVEWRIVGCDVPARWGDGFCNVSGTEVGTLTLARTEGDRLSGEYDNGVGWSGPVTAQVSIDGILTIAGLMGSERSVQTWSAEINEWRTQLSESMGMTGSYREILMLVGESSRGIVSFEVVSARR